MSKASPGLILVPRGDLCLDFANTLAWRGSAKDESLREFADLLRWCESSKALPANAIEGLARWCAKDAPAAAAVFHDAIQIRETIFRVFIALSSGTVPAVADLRMISRALEDAPARTNLVPMDDAFGWRIETRPVSAPWMLAAVVWSAADLIIAANRVRIRHCANDKCLWLFIDDSKNQSRRWCSMQACGNRAKAHRHYMRLKGE
jgi:predicted RNA-binding Zn ribbon-like protein